MSAVVVSLPFTVSHISISCPEMEDYIVGARAKLKINMDAFLARNFWDPEDQNAQPCPRGLIVFCRSKSDGNYFLFHTPRYVKTMWNDYLIVAIWPGSRDDKNLIFDEFLVSIGKSHLSKLTLTAKEIREFKMKILSFKMSNICGPNLDQIDLHWEGYLAQTSITEEKPVTTVPQKSYSIPIILFIVFLVKILDLCLSSFNI